MPKYYPVILAYSLFAATGAFAATNESPAPQRALQQAHQVAQKEIIQSPADAFILSTLAAKKAKEFASLNQSKDSDSSREE